MILQPDVKAAESGYQSRGDLAIAAAWCVMPRGMVVHQDQAGSPDLQGLSKYLSGIDRSFIDRPDGQQGIAQKAVAPIQIEHANLLDWQMCHFGAQEVEHSRGGTEDRATKCLGSQGVDLGRINRGKELGSASARHDAEAGAWRCCEDCSERAERGGQPGGPLCRLPWVYIFEKLRQAASAPCSRSRS